MPRKFFRFAAIFFICTSLIFMVVPRRAQAAVTSVSEDATTITVNVANSYRAIFTKGDTTDFLKIYDRAEDNSNPDLLLEDVGPYIDEGGIAFQLRYDPGRIEQIVEVSDTRVVIEVKGNFCRTSNENCVDDGNDDLSVLLTYTFTPLGVWVKNTTDFKTSGVALDSSDSNDGYNWINLEFDGTDAAFSDTASPAIYFGDGTTESSTTTDGAAFEDNNVYVVAPGQGNYQSILVGVTNWLSQSGGSDDWYWDENTTSTLDTLTARERGTTPTSIKTMSWFVRLATQGGLDTEAEREAVSNDQQNPDTLSFATGSAWQEVGSDDFNEYQGAYTGNFSSNEVLVDLDGNTLTRFSPFWKLKSWRSISSPTSASLDALWLTPTTTYNVSVQPIASAFWAKDIAIYTSLESSGAVTSPNIGPAGAVVGTTSFVSGKFGNGALMDADDEIIRFSGAGFTGNSYFDAESDFGTMSVEMWFKPTLDDDVATNMNFFRFHYDADDGIGFFKNTTGGLRLVVETNGTLYSYNVNNTVVSRYWEVGKWLHIRAEWDDAQDASTQQRLFLNGVEPDHTDPGSAFTITNLQGTPTALYVGNSAAGTGEVKGVLDELYVYSGSIQQLAAGGNTTDSDEYLNDSSKDYSLSFADDSTTNQAAYLFLAGETKFTGVNSSLATVGSGSSPAIDWEYWNGTGWSALTVTDTTSGANDFTASGNFYFSAPSDWVTYALSSSPDLYFIRAHLESGSFSTSPIEDTIRTDVVTFQYLGDVSTAAQSISIPMEYPSISFTVDAVPASTNTNGITTSAASTFNTLPFGSLIVGTPKYVAHQLSATTNAHFGYAVTLKLVNYMQGNYPGNNIDPFVASWSIPTTWTEPTGTSANANTGWIGANTSDTRVANWTNASGLFGGITSSAQTVMYSTGADDGSSVYVTYAIEVNDKQPADLYSGTVTYTITPTY